MQTLKNLFDIFVLICCHSLGADFRASRAYLSRNPALIPSKNR